jgi:hypothetical protein
MLNMIGVVIVAAEEGWMWAGYVAAVLCSVFLYGRGLEVIGMGNW